MQASRLLLGTLRQTPSASRAAALRLPQSSFRRTLSTVAIPPAPRSSPVTAIGFFGVTSACIYVGGKCSKAVTDFLEETDLFIYEDDDDDDDDD